MQQQPAVLTENATAVSRSEPPPAPVIFPLRIALLGYRSNPYSGGQGIYLKYLSAALADLGHSVDVISGEPYPELDARVRLIKLPGLNLFAHSNHVRALRPHHFRSAADLIEYFSMLTGGFSEPYTFGRRLVRFFREHRPAYDVVHDNQSLCHGLLHVEDLGYPLLATIHHPITLDRDIALASAPDWLHRLLIRRWHSFLRMQGKVARQLPLLVTVSESSKRDIQQAFGVPAARLQVVPNGIDTDAFAPVPSIPRDPLQLITTTSADQPLKGARHLLHAMRQLLDEEPRLRLIMIGKLKAGGTTERLLHELGLVGHVELHHGISAAQIRKLYARASIAVVPSDYEGFGLPAGEAMACEVPVVSTDAGALPEVVGDAGIIVPARDPAALANGIRTLLRDAHLRDRLARAGRQRIASHFSWRSAALRMTQLYRATIRHGA
jgi:glycosyltransferase involved in cell wall biosynthesis